MEVYKKVEDSRFPNCYEVSNKGNIRTIRRNKITNGTYKGWCNNFKGFIFYRYLTENNIDL